MRNTTPRRLWRTVAATMLGAVLVLPLSMVPASAAPVVDGSQTGSITVHKYERPEVPTGLPNNGTEVTVPGLDALADIDFTIQQVNTIDLTTNDGWQDANTLSGAFDPAAPAASITAAGYTLGAAQVQTTDAAGIAGFDNLPLGLFLVTETRYPAGVTPSAPFLISVPLTDPDALNTWLYDVHVYPKNSITTASKTVQDAAALALGDAISFTITGDIPNDAIIDGYKITDVLDPKVSYVDAEVSLVDGTVIAAGTDYTVTRDAASNTVTVEFTAAGRLLLAANNATEVQVILNATVNAIGEINNVANVYPNATSFTLLPGTPGGAIISAPVTTKWGALTLQKVDEAGANLAGATFSVFPSEADAVAGTNAITLGGQSEFTVAADGQLTLSGLRYSDFANGIAVAVGEPNFQTYFLVETVAPSGYELLAAPVAFTITAATTAAGVDLQVANVPSNGGFQLPLTGGPGTTLIYAGGVLLLAGAVLLFVRSRRRTSN